MPTTDYYSVNGILLGEATSGTETTYIPDALGSATQTITSAGVRNTYDYSLYGRQISKTGTDPDPGFLWNGRTQSRATGRAYAEQYNRRRHVGSTTAQWTTVDPTWPRIFAYSYCRSTPIGCIDPTGMVPACDGVTRPCPDGPCPPLTPLSPPTTPCNAQGEAGQISGQLAFNYCQAFRECNPGDPVPYFCNDVQTYPPEVYVSSGGKSDLAIAVTYCCGDGVGTCKGVVTSGNAWGAIGSCLQKCAYEHESKHVADCGTVYGTSAKTSASGNSASQASSTRLQYSEWTECAGYCASYNCLLAIMRNNSIAEPPWVSEASKLGCGRSRLSTPRP
jgi:RHS repeat-associated protein